jgi:hypothetical protein
MIPLWKRKNPIYFGVINTIIPFDNRVLGVSSINKIDRHDINEILLKVVLNTLNITTYIICTN